MRATTRALCYIVSAGVMHWFAMGLLAAVADATKDLVSKKTMSTASPYLAAWSLLTVAAPCLALAALATPFPELGERFVPSAVATACLFVAAVLLYMKALKASDISLTLPMIAFTPVFMLLTGPLILGELPALDGIAGVLVIVTGAYLLNLRDARRGLLRPLVALGREPGPRYMLGVALLFSVTATTAKQTIVESSPLVGISAIYCLSAILVSAYLFLRRLLSWKEISTHWRGVLLIGLLMAVSEFGMAHAFSLTLAVYAISVKRLSILIGAFYGVVLLKEKNLSLRLIGATVMLAGMLLIVLGPGR